MIAICVMCCVLVDFEPLRSKSVSDRDDSSDARCSDPRRRGAAMAVSASGAGPDADTCSRQSEAVSAARPRWRAKNRAELSRSYSGTG
jgi:hypothetical protein